MLKEMVKLGERAQEGAQSGDAPCLGKRTVRCTPDNAPLMQQALKHTAPAFLDLVKRLHTEGMVDGLRSVQITVHGTEQRLGQGLSALTAPAAAGGVSCK